MFVLRSIENISDTVAIYAKTDNEWLDDSGKTYVLELSPETSASQVEKLAKFFDDTFIWDGENYVLEAKATFDAFMEAIDLEIFKRIGLEHDDLEDWDWREEYECYSSVEDIEDIVDDFFAEIGAVL